MHLRSLAGYGIIGLFGVEGFVLNFSTNLQTFQACYCVGLYPVAYWPLVSLYGQDQAVTVGHLTAELVRRFAPRCHHAQGYTLTL